MIPIPRATDVFVVGGGPAGLAAAIAARRRGFDVTLVDCGVPPVDKACGEGVMPDGVAAAKSLGLDLENAGGHAFRGVRFCDGETTVEALFPQGSGRGLRRTLLHAAMVDRAAQCDVRMAWGARVHGISPAGVRIEDRLVRARWIVGADGGHSAVRRWAGLDASRRNTRRFGFRQHFRIAPWSEFMELHWADGCQLYVTPVSADEICVALISRDPCLRLEDALPHFPAMQRRLRGAAAVTPERGGVTASRKLNRVWAGNVALVGDASGSVDAITGDGLCLLFQHAEALAAAIEAGSLALYQYQHRRIGWRPALMAGLMLFLDQRRRLRRRTIRAMAERPRIFARMLAAHTGALNLGELASNGLALGWRMLTL
ncbi:MAG TPA: FAD-dependent monooxygenase [Candidatus Acidoferrales bacterium]|nr:FAD-dependent monooxygenase [Candidatus Acidoferrales bacterium]